MAEMAALSFGALLRQLRIDAGLTQEELAHAAGLSARSISDLERGITVAVRNRTVQLLADALSLRGSARDEFNAAARGRAPAEGAATGNRTVTCTLPGEVALFTGRGPELRELTVGPDQGTGIRVIGGMPGAGKTALAVHAAYLLRDRFPDWQLFIDLHGHTPGRKPMPPETALAELLAAMGVDPRFLPRDLHGRAGLWRDRTAGQRALLVLDNAADSGQVTPLLPGGNGCVVLVTSRRSLGDLPGAIVPILLQGLPPAQATDMFLQVAPRATSGPREEAEELVQLVGYLPLAISLLARVYMNHPAWTLSDLIGETKTSLLTLTAERVSIAGAFDVSYRYLTADHRLVLRRLSEHPGTTVDAFSAAVLADVPLHQAGNGLEVLHNEGLLTEVSYRRYAMHDLIRRYAQNRSGTDPAADRDEAVERLLDYYQYVATISQTRLARHPPTESEAAATGRPPAAVPDLRNRARARSWIRTERANLFACLDYVTRAGQHARVLALTAALAALLRQDGPLTEAVTRHTVAVDAARHLGDRLGEAIALGNQGDVRRLAGDYPGAVEAARAALEIFRDLGDRVGEANALTNLGSALYFLDDYAVATECQETALRIYRDLGERLGQGHALAELGAVRSVAGDYPGAIEALEIALGIFADCGNQVGQANVLNYLGVVRRLTGDFPGAEEGLKAALDIFRELGNPGGEANALTELGAVYSLIGDHTAADEVTRAALGICRDLGDRGGEAVALGFLGNARRSTGDYAGAAEALGEALAIFQDLGDRGGEANALNDIAAVHRLDHDLHRAVACHQHSLELARKIGSEWDEAHALAGLGRCALALDRPGEAVAELRQSLEIFQRIGAAEASSIAAELDALTQRSLRLGFARSGDQASGALRQDHEVSQPRPADRGGAARRERFRQAGPPRS
jgi:tetratricopeptide (TPR) repeat protein/transcriptional regulator with XRE-family HTH domain